MATALISCPNSDWTEGRRIVDLTVLAEGLRCCKGSGCFSPLYLYNCTDEKRYGLGSDLCIPCIVCGNINTISTGLKCGESNDRPTWVINTECKSGMLQAGLREEAVACLFASMHIPGIDFESLRCDDIEDGETISDCFEEIDDYILEEATIKHEETETSVVFEDVQPKHATSNSIPEIKGKLPSEGHVVADDSTCSSLDLIDKMESEADKQINLYCNQGDTLKSEGERNDSCQSGDIADSCSSSPDESLEHTPKSVKKLFKCSTCGASFRKNAHLSRHQRTHTNEKPFKCDVCGKCFALSNLMSQHTKTHTEKKLFTCDICEESFKRPKTLERHKKTHPSNESYTCEICNKTFKHAGHFSRHTKMCTERKPKSYQCDICGKCFASTATFSVHKITHTGEKSHKCDICGKGFTTAGGMREHRRIHTGEKPFVCEICGQSFVRSSDIHHHMKIHTGVKPYKCDTCGRCFRVPYHLSKHKKVHTGEKPHACDYCGKCFIERSAMMRHRRIHTGEKPFECDLCGRCFNQPGSVKLHKKIHSQ